MKITTAAVAPALRPAKIFIWDTSNLLSHNLMIISFNSYLFSGIKLYLHDESVVVVVVVGIDGVVSGGGPGTLYWIE